MRTMRMLLMVVVAGGLSAAAFAHHGGNLYDTTKPVVLEKATITKFEWGTPHNQIFFDARDARGEVQHWVASTEPAGVMLERGWTRRSLNAGDVVTVYIFQAKNGATVGNLQKIVLADGRELLAAGGAQPQQSAPAQR